MFILYLLVLGFVQSCKWIELQILKFFSPLTISFVRGKLTKAGIIIHFPKDDKWTAEDEKKALEIAKSGNNFDSLIHIKSKEDSSWLIDLANKGSITFCEKYIDGSWDVDNLETLGEVMRRAILTLLPVQLQFSPWNRFFNYLEFRMFNFQTLSKAMEVIDLHYNSGRDLYESFLDPHMQYSCGYWAKADNLNDAQINKMELIAQKLDLKPGMRVLDIGCGWGTLCKYLAERHGVSCVGVDISEDGVKNGRKICAGLPVDIRFRDYRHVNEKFDRIVSIGMLEHVGVYNYREFFQVAHRCLDDDGIMLIESIGMNHPGHIVHQQDPFSHNYIFPNGMLPLPSDITASTFGLFVIEDWHNFGQDYAKTLAAWRDNFVSNWPSIAHRYGKKFYRLWTIFLSAGVGFFQTRRYQLWQLVLTKDGIKKEYRAAR